jgi:hypothetical protein
MYIYSERTKLSTNTAVRTNGADASGRVQIDRSGTHVPSATARQVFNVVLHSGHFGRSRASGWSGVLPGAMSFSIV